MKNLFFISFAVAGMMFASCSSDETVEMVKNQNAIEFKTFINNSTRANDVTIDNFYKFTLWGKMTNGTNTGTPFDAVDCSKTSGVWSYGTPVYWNKGYEYSFEAIAPKMACTFTPGATCGTWGSLSFNNGTGDIDLLYAAKKCDKVIEGSCPAPVDLQFNHILSRVRFEFINAMDDKSVLKVTDVHITNAYSEGTATLAENLTDVSWTSTNTGDLNFGDVVTKVTELQGRTEHKYLIPIQKDYVITFKVKRTHHGIEDNYNHTVTIPALALKPGNSYDLIATINASNVDPSGEELCPIQFNISVNGWGNFTDTTMPEY